MGKEEKVNKEKVDDYALVICCFKIIMTKMKEDKRLNNIEHNEEDIEKINCRLVDYMTSKTNTKIWCDENIDTSKKQITIDDIKGVILNNSEKTIIDRKKILNDDIIIDIGIKANELLQEKVINSEERRTIEEHIDTIKHK